MEEYLNEKQSDFYKASYNDDRKILVAYLNLLNTPEPNPKLIREIEKWLNQGYGIAKWMLSELKEELEHWKLPEHGLEVDGEGESLWGVARKDKRVAMLEQLKQTHTPAPYTSPAKTVKVPSATKIMKTPVFSTAEMIEYLAISTANKQAHIDRLMSEIDKLNEDLTVEIALLKEIAKAGE